MNIEHARFNMIEQQIRPWGVLDSSVLSALEEVPREAFVPPEFRHLAFADIEIPIGAYGAAIHTLALAWCRARGTVASIRLRNIAVLVSIDPPSPSG